MSNIVDKGVLTSKYIGLQPCPDCGSQSFYSDLKQPNEKASRILGHTDEGMTRREMISLGLESDDKICPNCSGLMVREAQSNE